MRWGRKLYPSFSVVSCKMQWLEPEACSELESTARNYTRCLNLSYEQSCIQWSNTLLSSLGSTAQRTVTPDYNIAYCSWSKPEEFEHYFLLECDAIYSDGESCQRFWRKCYLHLKGRTITFWPLMFLLSGYFKERFFLPIICVKV